MIDKDAVVNRHQLYNKNNFLAMKKCKTRQTAVVVLRKLVKKKKYMRIARGWKRRLVRSFAKLPKLTF